MSINNYSKKDNFIEDLNSVFIDERAQYKIIDGVVTPLISGEEAEEVEKAIESKDFTASKHIKKAIKELYGWTSDEGGIRHAENGKELKIDEKEARYMLVQCSALVNYIIAKI